MDCILAVLSSTLLFLAAFTLNHIFLEDRKLRTYEQPNTTDSLMAAEPEAVYERKSQE